MKLKKRKSGKLTARKRCMSFILAFLMFGMSACGNTVTNSGLLEDAAETEEKAKTKSSDEIYLLTSVTYQDDEVECTTDEYTYDREGNMLTHTLYLSEGVVYSMEEYTYYEDGSVKSCETTQDGEALGSFFTNMKAHTYYEYNSQGDVVFSREYTYTDGEVEYYDEFTYDDAGNVLIGKRIEADGTIEEWQEASYYDDGTMAGYVTYDSDGVLVEEVTYNEDGNLLTSTKYDEDGSVASVTECIYDEDGNKLSSETTKGEKVTARIDYTYDSAGNLLSEISSRGEYKHMEYTYDASGNMLTKISYDSEGEMKYQYVYTYDRNGEQMSEVFAYAGQDEMIRSVATYDDNGNCLTHTWSSTEDENLDTYDVYTYYADGTVESCVSTLYDLEDGKNEVISVTACEYDESGNLLSETVDYTDGDDTKEEYTYDASGNELTEASYKNGEAVSSKEYEYDDAGNMVKTTYFDENGEKGRVVEWEYDADGNLSSFMQYNKEGVLTKKTVYADDSVVEKNSVFLITQFEEGDEEVLLTNISYNDDGTVESGYERILDEDGYILSYIYTQSSGEVYEEDYSYSDDELVLNCICSTDGVETGTYTYEYMTLEEWRKNNT